jgi:alkanesulfonate monooxygenase SsuD/methylene tetrahydromethanopterin reductase-like flavin-dependent oxidoreductase (luciferase family)
MRTNAFHLAWVLQGSSIRAWGAPWTGLSVDLVGTPDQVAAQMGEVIEEVGGDGFMFSIPKVSRRTMAEITDGLVPALRRRGLTRGAYAHRHLRDNPLEF